MPLWSNFPSIAQRHLWQGRWHVCGKGRKCISSAIEDVIRGIKGFGGEYRIIITREKTMDEIIVQAEYAKGVDSGTVPKLKKRLEAELKAKGLRSVVQMVETDRLERTEFRGERVIDKRSLYDEITHQK
jgi:phenylacetate-coenzyme A ligase PaaK-like adenylate-forming protein